MTENSVPEEVGTTEPMSLKSAMNAGTRVPRDNKVSWMV